jgi:N-acyl homoserine lactone hydrolase
MALTIRPINTGFIKVDTGVHVTSGRNVGVKVEIPSVAWLIEGGKKLILVDTGMAPTKMADWHHPGSYQPDGMDIGSQLRKLRIDPDAIATVVFTHLHWDHCYNMKIFKRAEFIVSQAELDFALNPIPPYYKSYESPVLGLKPPFAGVDFTVVNGEQEIAPGVVVFQTPGHSPGHQSIEAQAPSGKYIIAGDAVFVYENLKGDPAAHLPYLPIGRFVNYFDMWNSIEAIVKRGGNVLPGHEMKVLNREIYA